MNVKLIAAAIATLGLAACTPPDITPQASTDPGGATATSAPAQPVAEQQAVPAVHPSAAPPVGEETKEEETKD